MRALISGADGNLGSHFAREPGVEALRIGRGNWDEMDSLLERRADLILHAASDLLTPVVASPVSVLDSNVMTTARALEAARRHSVPKFAFISSCAVYGREVRTAETEACRPESINGMGKLLCERLALDFCAAHGIRIQIFRVFNTYGGRDRFSILSRLEDCVARDVSFTLNNKGRAGRDFIHVSDVASLVRQVLERDSGFPVVNIGTGVATTISSLLDIVREFRPSLRVIDADVDEVDYSRADVQRLRTLLDLRVRDVKTYFRSRIEALTVRTTP